MQISQAFLHVPDLPGVYGYYCTVSRWWWMTKYGEGIIFAVGGVWRCVG